MEGRLKKIRARARGVMVKALQSFLAARKEKKCPSETIEGVKGKHLQTMGKKNAKGVGRKKAN